VKVEPGEDDIDNNFVESADPGSVSGLVEDVDGNPLEGVVLTLDDGDAATVDPTATTAADGTVMKMLHLKILQLEITTES